MPRIEGKKTYTVVDIWQAYVDELLKEHPGAYTRHGQSISRYYVYKKVNGKRVEIMTYARFRRVLEHYYDKAKTAIIRGEAVDMYAGVGKICMRRVERDFRKKRQMQINWYLTKKQPLVWSEQKGRLAYKHVIYFTSDDWVRIGWQRHNYLTNETQYAFQPTATNAKRSSGFRLELTNAMNRDPLLKYQYLYIPKLP